MTQDPKKGSSLTYSSLMYGFGHAIPAGLAFLLMTICAFYLPSRELGIIGLAEATSYVVSHLTMMALPASLRRLYFSGDGGIDRTLLISSILRGGLVIALIGIFISMFLGPVIFDSLPLSLPEFFPYFAYAIGYQVWYHFLEYRLTLYQLHDRPVAYAALHAMTGLTIFVFVIWMVVVREDGASGFLLGRLLGAALVTVIVLYGMRSYFFGGWSKRIFKAALRYSVPLVPHSLAMTVLNVADRFLLEAYTTTAVVGVYTFAYTLASAMYLVTIAFSMAWGPFFFRVVSSGKGSYQKIYDFSGKAVAVGMGIAIFGVVISRDFINHIFPEEYHSAAPIVPLIIAGHLLFFLNAIFSYSILHNKKTYYFAPITLLAAVVNIGLNLYWIPTYGMAGAAWATVVAFAFQAWIVYFVANKVLSVRYPVKNILLMLGVFLAVVVVSQQESLDHSAIYLAAILAALMVLKVLFGWPRFAAGR